MPTLFSAFYFLEQNQNQKYGSPKDNDGFQSIGDVPLGSQSPFEAAAPFPYSKPVAAAEDPSEFRNKLRKQMGLCK